MPSVFQSQKAYEVARGTLGKGEGIGSPLIRTYLGMGDEDLCPRGKQGIIDAPEVGGPTSVR